MNQKALYLLTEKIIKIKIVVSKIAIDITMDWVIFRMWILKYPCLYTRIIGELLWKRRVEFLISGEPIFIKIARGYYWKILCVDYFSIIFLIYLGVWYSNEWWVKEPLQIILFWESATKQNTQIKESRAS